MHFIPQVSLSHKKGLGIPFLEQAPDHLGLPDGRLRILCEVLRMTMFAGQN